MGYTMCVAEVGTSYLVVAENATNDLRITLDANGSFTETDISE